MKVLLYYFCLIAEGSGVGSVPRTNGSSETWLYSRADGNIDESNEELRQQIIKIFKIVDMDMLDKCCPGPSCKFRKKARKIYQYIKLFLNYLDTLYSEQRRM
jgi:hypothetical protein